MNKNSLKDEQHIKDDMGIEADFSSWKLSWHDSRAKLDSAPTPTQRYSLSLSMNISIIEHFSSQEAIIIIAE